MPLRNTQDRYGSVARAAHWLAALLILGGFSLALYMTDLPLSPQRLKLYSWHKWIGVTVLLLALLRLLWRGITHAPPLPGHMPAWEQAAARLSHWTLYALMLATPVAGWLMSSAKGFQTVYFGVLPIPDLLEKNPPLGKTLAEVHEILAWTLIALVAVHAAAALKHHFRDRDAVLAGMLPGVTPPSRDRKP